jgi:hypothetical protein
MDHRYRSQLLIAFTALLALRPLAAVEDAAGHPRVDRNQ